MPVAELHFFHADDPNGSTIFECSTDDEFVKSIELDIQRDSLGSGRVTFARKVPAGGLFQREIIEPETLVRVLLPAISETKYYAGFFINPRQQQVISEAESGGEGFTFAGPGPKHYLERMLLWSASFSGNDNAVDRDAGVWTWPETAKVGRILNRLIEEDDDNPNGPFLPDLTKSFGDVNDSDSVAWTDNVSGTDDLTLRIQDTYLKILWILEDLSGMTTDIDLGEVGDPLLQLNAYQTYGTDRTASILFEEGVNIAAELNVEGSSYAKASHALVKGDDGVYELAVRTGWSPGDLKKVVATSWDSSNNTQLDNAGVRFLRRQQNGEKQIKLNIIPGTTALAGEYFPGPPGTGSDFWVGDTISLTTGMGSPTELDYNDEPQVVTGIQLELLEAARDDTTLQAARSWAVTLALNEERKSSNTSRDLAGSRGTVAAPPNVLRLCPPSVDCNDLIAADLTAATAANGGVESGASTQWSGGSVSGSMFHGGSQGYSRTGDGSLVYTFNPAQTFEAGVRYVLDIWSRYIEDHLSHTLVLGVDGVDQETATFTGAVGPDDPDVYVDSGTGADGQPWVMSRVCWTPNADRTGARLEFTANVDSGAWAVDDLALYTTDNDTLSGTSPRAARCDHGHHARDIPYSNGGSGLSASDVQAALDELAAAGSVTDHGALTGLGDDDHTQYLLRSIMDAKGDILAASAADVIGRLPVGSDDQVLTVDSSQALGIKWADASSSGGGGIGEILISDTPSTPLIFADLLQNEAQSDLVYGELEAGGGGGTTDHGSLTGLGDNDHPQYVRADSNYRIVLGILRKTGGTWSLLDDTNHTPVGLGSVSADSSKITVNYSTAFSEIGSSAVTVDETWAQSYHAGASVGLSSVEIYLTDMDGATVDPTGVSDSANANIWIMVIGKD